MKIGNWLILDTFPAFLPMITISIYVAITRLLSWQYAGNRNSTLWFCGLLPIMIGLLILVLALVVHSIRFHHSVLPLLTLGIGIYLAFQIPLPDKPDTPEKVYFLEHHADYEATVELVRTNRVIMGDCSPNYLPPRSFPHVSSERCMGIQRDTERGLMIYFYPLEPFYHLIAYIEFDDIQNPCGQREPFVEQKIEAHWYVCYHDWN